MLDKKRGKEKRGPKRKEVTREWRHADSNELYTTLNYSSLEGTVVAVRSKSFYSHNNGMYSDFLFEFLWMDRGNKNHGMAF